MIFTTFIFFFFIVKYHLSELIVKNPIPDQHIEKYGLIDLVISKSTFENTDKSDNTSLWMTIGTRSGESNHLFYQSYQNPFFQGEFDFNFAEEFDIYGDFAYIIDKHFGFRIVDLRNKKDFVAIGEYILDFSNDLTGIKHKSNFTYISSISHGLLVFDVNDLTKPVLINTLSYNNITQLFLQDNILYLLEENGLVFYLNISNPRSPKYVGNFSINEESLGIYVVGSSAYIWTETKKIYLVNISNPIEKPSYSFSSIVQKIFDLVVDEENRYLYMIGMKVSVKQASVIVVDISLLDIKDSLDFTQVVYKTYNNRIINVGDYVYALVNTPTEKNIVFTVDVSDKSNIKKIKTLTVPYAKEIFYPRNSNRLFVAAQTRGIYELDISEPSTPTLISVVSSETGELNILKRKGDFLFTVIDRVEIRVYDIRSLTTTVIVSRFFLDKYIADIWIDEIEDLMYVFRCPYSSELIVYRYYEAIPLNLVVFERVGSLDLSIHQYSLPACYLKGAFVRFPFAYYPTGYFLGKQGIGIVNITNSSNPFYVATWETDYYFDLTKFVVDKEGDYVYASIMDNNQAKLFCVSLADKMNPFLLSQFIVYQNMEITYHYDELTDCQFLFGVAETGLKVMNITNPSNIQSVFFYEDITSRKSAVIEKSTLFLWSDHHQQISVFGIGDPSNPVLQERLSYNDYDIRFGSINDLFTKENILYIGTSEEGIRIVSFDIVITGSSHFDYFCGSIEIEVTAYSNDEKNSVVDIFAVFKENYCNNRGICLPSFKCECSEIIGYEGENCETWSCNENDFKNFKNACNGKGFCVSPDSCECRSPYVGKFCETNLLNYYVGIPLASVSGIFSLIFLFFLINVCVLIFTIFFSCICVLCWCTCGLLTILTRLFPKLKKYQRLRDFDILLNEQLLEDDDSIAYLKINKELFEVPFKEITFLKMIGSGGSEASVFLVRWRGTEVAFKCFKTKLLCESQQRFDMFEKEVYLLANLHHPNVIRFLGACLNPPRVGILMELCEKGEILDFFISKKNKDGIGYPMKEKIRMCREIISAVEYIHSRDIIHRDIKPENILITSSETAKLMDFGISRLVKNNDAMKTRKVGTSFFIAPEVLIGEYDELCDSFSFSILLWMLFTEDKCPYGENIDFSIEYNVANDNSFRPNLEQLKECLSLCEQEEEDINKNGRRYDWLVNVIKRCWDEEVSRRYSFSQLSEIFEKEEIQ